MSYLNRNRLKNFFINLKKYFKSEEFLNSMAISNAEIDNIANTAGYNDNGTGTVNYDFVPRSGGGVITGNSMVDLDMTVVHQCYLPEKITTMGLVMYFSILQMAQMKKTCTCIPMVHGLGTAVPYR